MPSSFTFAINQLIISTIMSQNDDCCCSFLFTIILGFVFFSYLHRNYPVSTTIPTTVFPRLEVNSVKVSNFNLSNPISANWKIDLNIVNYYSNDISFGFNDNVITIFHGNALWLTSFQEFNMNAKNPKVHFTPDFWRLSTKVDNSTIEAIREEIANNYGVVKFIVQFKAHKPIIWFKNPFWRFRYDTNIDVLVSSCEVELLFGSPEKTQANMIRI